MEQVKSKDRVVNYGEVFTNPREVNAMLDLVKHETERIDSRFLEPACGTGNFLVEILRHKLEVVERKYVKVQQTWEQNAFWALTSIYGIDILPDNVEDCKTRLFSIISESYYSHKKWNHNEAFLRAAKFVLDLNVIWGDALSLKVPDSSQKPITFTEWSPIGTSGKFQRREYQMDELLKSEAYSSTPLFSDQGKPAHIPREVAIHEPVHFLLLAREILVHA